MPTDRSKTLFQSLASAAVGGVIGGLVVGLLMRPAAPDTAPSPDPAQASEGAAATGARPSGAPAADGNLVGRIDQLEQQLAELRRRQSKRRELAAYARKLAGDDAGTPRALAVDAEDPGFELAVREVLDRAQTEREETRQDRRAERTQRWVDGQLDFLSEELGMSDEQVSKVEVILNQQAETFRELRDRDNDNRPATRREWRAKMDEIRAQTRSALSEVLNDEQLTGYDKIQEEERGGRGGRR